MSEKRQELETIAADLVQRSGLHNLSFRTLANAVGVKSSSVHYYFPEKSSLASVLIENYTTGLRERLQKIDRRDKDLKKKLDAFVKIFEDVLKAEKLCLCGIMAAEVSTLSEENRQQLRDYFSLAENWLCALLDQHQSAIHPAIKPPRLAKIILSGLEGAILIDRVEDGRDHLRAQKELIHSFLL